MGRATHLEVRRPDLLRALVREGIIVLKKAMITLFALALLWFGVYPRAESLFGPLGIWGRLVGVDLSSVAPVDFARFSRRSSPTDALICGAGICAAKSDAEVPVFGETADQLMKRLDGIFGPMERSERISQGEASLHHRYVIKTRLMRYPDIVDVEVFAVDDAHATFAVYGRSIIGSYDYGVNKARNEKIMEQVTVASMP